MKGDVASNYKQYLGILLENYIASTLFKLIKQHGDSIEIYYDPKKGGVDFIIKDLTNKPIPIEVGIGKKNKKQIKSAIKKYNADIGIIISDKTDSIIKDENIIYIPYTTFSLI
jgi:predicted AAA+ superfamily ATPase